MSPLPHFTRFSFPKNPRSPSKIGDVVNFPEDYIELNWVDGEKPNWVDGEKPNPLIILDILELGDDWIVAEVNGTYKQSDGALSTQILLSSLKTNVIETRNIAIDQLIAPDIEQNKNNKY